MVTPEPSVRDRREDFSLDDRYLTQEGEILVTGIQALVRTVRDRALRDRRRGLVTSSLVSGYEGSPLGGYDLEFARRERFMEGLDIVLRPAVNEELAATSVMGTQLASQVGTMRSNGITGYWYGKSPGLDRASDAVRHANLIGTDRRGGAVAIVGDDPSGKSSSLACASETMLASLMVPTLYPADVQDVLDYGIHAVEMSRFTGLWSALKIVTNVADGTGTAVVHPDRPYVDLGDLEPSSWVPHARTIAPSLLEMERSRNEDRFPLAAIYARAARLDRVTVKGSADRIGLVAAGKSYLDLCEALHRLGLSDDVLQRVGVRILKVAMIHPLEPRGIREFADGLMEIIVVEEKGAFLEDAIKATLHARPDAPRVVGKTDGSGGSLLPSYGELDAMVIARHVGRRLAEVHGIEVADQPLPGRPAINLPLLNRTPYFCSGCPHSSSTKVPEDTLVGGGIGCHSMVMLMDDAQTGNVIGLTQMGGEGAQWIGMEPFVEEGHFVQNLGDGTFTHSGSLALRASIAAGVNVTYKLLYNATVAMTGGQDPVGAMTLDQLVRVLLAEGVAKVVVTTEDPHRVRKMKLPRGIAVRDRADIIDVQRELAAIKGVTVLVHDQECAAEKRRKRRRGLAETPTQRIVINERVCEGCGDCGVKSNCLSVQPVETEFGRKTQIHQSSCNLDYSCLAGDCPSFMMVEPGGERPKQEVPALDNDLPEPERELRPGDFSMRITGTGGTGVVTLSQVLATAAFLDGRQVSTLDQTGLAQKGGAVVSDLRLSPGTRKVTPKLTDGSCDLYLVCDALVGADAKNLTVASSDRTISIVSTAEVPTGSMVVDTAIRYPDQARIGSAIERNSARALMLDPAALSREIFRDEQYANFLLTGAAYQSGALPLSAASIERAIELNGVSAAANVQAFRRGRQAVADPLALRAALGRHDTANADSGRAPRTLEELVTHRAQELTAYQDRRYAGEFVAFLQRVTEVEQERLGNDSTVLSEAVARNLYKLMAYKDEYEVARLLTDPSVDESLVQNFGSRTTRSVLLHPPTLRAIGFRNKVSLGRWAWPGLRVLATGKVLRGTMLDPFGRAHVRRVERALVVEYRDLLSQVLTRLDARSLGIALQVAELPDVVRGYEEVKLRNVAKFREQAEELLRQLEEIDLAIA